MNNGVWYADAHHAHANTETIVGHTHARHRRGPRDPRHDRERMVGSPDR
jgi:hypothetical protein